MSRREFGRAATGRQNTDHRAAPCLFSDDQPHLLHRIMDPRPCVYILYPLAVDPAAVPPRLVYIKSPPQPSSFSLPPPLSVFHLYPSPTSCTHTPPYPVLPPTTTDKPTYEPSFHPHPTTPSPHQPPPPPPHQHTNLPSIAKLNVHTVPTRSLKRPIRSAESILWL